MSDAPFTHHCHHHPSCRLLQSRMYQQEVLARGPGECRRARQAKRTERTKQGNVDKLNEPNKRNGTNGPNEAKTQPCQHYINTRVTVANQELELPNLHVVVSGSV